MKQSLFFLAMFLSLSSGVYATTMDSMDSISGWTTSKDDNTTISLTNVSCYSGNANKITYDLTNGNWVQIDKRFDNSNLAGGDSIKFYYKGTGNSNNIELKLFDADGDIAATVLNGISNTSNWTPATVMFSGFDIWEDSDGNPFGDGEMDLQNITRFCISVVRKTGGSGTLLIDNVELYLQNAPGTYIIDQCETRTNNFSSYVSTAAGGGTGWVSLSIESSNPSPKGGNYYKISYATGTSGWIIGAEESLGNFGATSYSYINFYSKIETGSEEPEFEVHSDSGFDKKAISAYGALDYDWKFYSVPLSDFSVNISTLTAVKITFSSGEGIVYLDHLWFSTVAGEAIAAGPVSTIDKMEGPFSALTYPWCKDKDATVSLSTTDGYLGNAMQISYNFNSGNWITIERGMGNNLSADKGFRFRCKGTGNANHLEFKVEDMDGVLFYRKLLNFTNTDGVWKTVSIPHNELTLFTAGINNDETLDLKSIKKIFFAITKSDNGGAGSFTIDELETISDTDFVKKRPGKIITQVSIDNNPFSPNGDGVKDLATFSYTLSDYAAEIVLEIYDLTGESVKKIEQREKFPGSHSDLYWNGEDDNGNLVRNGLYIYKVRAKTLDGKRDHITHIIGVIK